MTTVAFPTPSNRRTTAYKREMRIALAKGISPEAILDLVQAFRNENPPIEEVRDALRGYEPTLREMAQMRGEVA